MPLLFLLAFRMRRVVYPSSWEMQARMAEMVGVVDDAVSGVRVVKGFGQEDRELDRVIRALGRLFGSRMRNCGCGRDGPRRSRPSPQLGQAVAVLALGGWLRLHGRDPVGTLVAFFTYLTQLMAPARQMAGVLVIAQQARAGAERVLELLDSLPDVAEKPDAVELAAAAAAGSASTTSRSATCAPSRSSTHFTSRSQPGRDGGARRDLGIGQVDGRAAAPALLRRPAGRGQHRRHRRARRHLRLAAAPDRRGVRGQLPLLRHGPGQHRLRAARRHRRARSWRRPGRPRPTRSSRRCPTATTPSSASGACSSRAASASASPSPGRCSPTRGSCSSTTPPRRSTAAIEEEIHATLRRLMVGRTTILIAHRRSTLRLADRIVVVDGGRVRRRGHPRGAAGALRAVPQTCLSGPGDDAEGDGGREAPRTRRPPPPGVAATRGRPGRRATRPRPRSPGSLAAAGSSWAAWHGRRTARGGRGRGMRAGLLAHRPPRSCCAGSRRCRPSRRARRRPGEREPESCASRSGSSGSCVRSSPSWRSGCVLVVLDAAAGLVGPSFTGTSVTASSCHHDETRAVGARRARSRGRRWSTGRSCGPRRSGPAATSERMLYAMRVRIFAHLQRLGHRLLRPRDDRADPDPHDHRRRHAVPAACRPGSSTPS